MKLPVILALAVSTAGLIVCGSPTNQRQYFASFILAEYSGINFTGSLSHRQSSTSLIPAAASAQRPYSKVIVEDRDSEVAGCQLDEKLPGATEPTAPYVRITHVTRYEYDKPVTLSPHIIRLNPALSCRTPITDYKIDISPKEFILSQNIEDQFSNSVRRYITNQQISKFEIKVQFTAQLIKINPFDFLLESHAVVYPFAYTDEEAAGLAMYLKTSTPGPQIKSFLADLPQEKKQTMDYIVFINRKISDLIKYEERIEAGTQSPEETLIKKKGACRDSASLLVEILRQRGLAARYRGGYLVTRGAKADEYSVGLHAWTEVFLPGAGWIGLDPTSGLLTEECHIPLACGIQSKDTSPVVGSFSSRGKADSTLHVEMKASIVK